MVSSYKQVFQSKNTCLSYQETIAYLNRYVELLIPVI